MCHHKYCLTSGKEEKQRTKRCYSAAKFYLLYPPFISSKGDDPSKLIFILSSAKSLFLPQSSHFGQLPTHEGDLEYQQMRCSGRQANFFWKLQHRAKQRSFEKPW